MTTLEQAELVFRDRCAGEDLRELLPDPLVVLDVGAGKGEFATSAFSLWPRCTVHSFEPSSRFNLTLQPLNSRHVINRIALGDFDGEATFYNTYGPESNSLLEFLPGNPLEKMHRVVGTETVTVRTLDGVCRVKNADQFSVEQGMKQVSLLKMDVQGAEIRVLQGARRLLEVAKPVIYCEVAFQPQYQDHPLLADVDEYLDGLGYERLYLYEGPMPEIWGDAIYVPKEAVKSRPESGPIMSDRLPSEPSESTQPLSLNVGADDTAAKEVTPKVRAICGLPRIGWNDSWQSLVDAMHAARIPIETFQGCFWAQCMQNGLSRALQDGVDWVVTLDYDSLILPMHVHRLLEILASRPDIDAVAALQMRRQEEKPLLGRDGDAPLAGNAPLEVKAAHFGLTAIRVSKLARMKKPWLIDVPDEDGEYSGKHIDADMYFWKQWYEAGNTLFIAPDVRIGHLELLVSEFDEQLKPRHYHVGDWWNMHARMGHCMRTSKKV